MADLTPTGGQDRKRSKVRSHKRSTRVDMTAMVDVAFLLLTFFVLTATISKEHLMEMIVPPECDGIHCFKKINHNKILTLVLDEQDAIQYYVGITDPQIDSTDYSADGLRKVLSDFVYGDSHRLGRPLCTEVDNQGINTGQCWDPIILIKAKDKSRYNNLVDALDELAIVRVPKFTIAPYTPSDSLLLAQAVE